jgi:hypothetical protein
MNTGDALLERALYRIASIIAAGTRGSMRRRDRRALLFPTLIRSAAQGITFAVVRIALGLWSFFVPVLTATGFTRLAWILTGFL